MTTKHTWAVGDSLWTLVLVWTKEPGLEIDLDTGELMPVERVYHAGTVAAVNGMQLAVELAHPEDFDGYKLSCFDARSPIVWPNAMQARAYLDAQEARRKGAA